MKGKLKYATLRVFFFLRVLYVFIYIQCMGLKRRKAEKAA